MCSKDKGGLFESSLCYGAGGMPPIIQSNIKGIKICGKRRGRNFKNAVRPDFTTGTCPEEYRACFPMDSENLFPQIQTTTCYHVAGDEDEDYCPITGITFDLTQAPRESIGLCNQILINFPGTPFTKIYYTKANF